MKITTDNLCARVNKEVVSVDFVHINHRLRGDKKIGEISAHLEAEAETEVKAKAEAAAYAESDADAEAEAKA